MNSTRLAKFFMFGLRKFSPYIDKVQILMIFPNFRPPVVEKLRRQNDNIWQFGRQPDVDHKFRETSVQFDIFRRQVALQMCCSYVGKEKCTSGLLCVPLRPSFPQRTSFRGEIYSFAREFRVLQNQVFWSLYVIS